MHESLFDPMFSLKRLIIIWGYSFNFNIKFVKRYVMSEDINALFWSIIMYSGMLYFVITFSIKAFPISSDPACVV